MAITNKKLTLGDIAFILTISIGGAITGYEWIRPAVKKLFEKPKLQIAQTIEQEKPKFKLEEKVKQYQDPKTNDFTNDSDTMLLARLIYGEARGKSDELKTAVAYSVLNRVERNSWYGKTPREVMLKRRQYSCFNPNDPNFEKVKDPLKYEKPEVWRKCYDTARKVLERQVEDPTDGSTHYHTDQVRPKWRNIPTKKIDNTLFYSSVN